MGTKKIDLSVVPCKNAEKYISLCLDALLKQTHPFLQLEILVVDNGSTDKTLEILKKYASAIKLFNLPVGTISEVRNYGAKNSRGEWLAFIDADVEVNRNWSANLIRAIDGFRKKGINLSDVITGSTYLIPQKSSWIERVWFEQLISRDKISDRYINSGNLILHRRLFDRIGGFDPAYETCEDEKLCSDARSQRGKIIKEKAIIAIHHGYPKSLKQFFKRERWHGLGMINDISRPWRSRELSLSLYFLLICTALLFSLISNVDIVISGTVAFLCLLLPLFAIAISRSISRPTYIFPLTLLYFLYGCARICSLFDITFNYIRKRKRNL